MILDLVFPGSPVGQVVEDVVAHYQQLADSKGVVIFGEDNCRRGQPSSVYKPSWADTPFCHVWLDRITYSMKSVPAYPIMDGGQITLYVGVFSNDNEVDAQYARSIDDLSWWMANALSHPDVGLDPVNNPGMAFENTWREFVRGDDIIVDDAANNSRWSRLYKFDKPWVARTITFRFKTMGEIRS